MRAIYRQGLIWIALLHSEMVSAGGIWPLLEPGCFPADGGPPIEIAVYVEQWATAPEIRAKAEYGSFGLAQAVGNGLYYLPFYPPQLKTRQKSRWNFWGQSDGKSISTDTEVELCPNPAGQVRVSAKPEYLIAGEGQQAILDIEVLDEFENPVPEARLDITVNTGEIKNLHLTNPGHYQAVYLPPKDPFPQIAIVMVVNAASARFDRLAVGRTIIPITARIELPGKTTPGTKMTINVAGRNYGPVTSDERGNFTLPVLVPPGVQRGLATSIDRVGNRTSRWVDFFLPPTNQLGLWVYPRQLAADGRSSARILVTTMEANGRPLDTEKVRLEVDQGRITGLRRIGPGLLEAYYQAPRSPSGGLARLAVTFLSGGPRSRTEAQVKLLAAPVRELAVESPTSLPADGRTRKTARVFALGEDKTPVGGKLLKLQAERLQIEPPQEVSPGVFEIGLKALPHPEIWLARLEIEVQEPQGELPDHILVPRDGLSRQGGQYAMECFLLDQSNRPVAEQGMEFSLLDVHLITQTDAFGRAEFIFSPPSTEGAPRPVVFSVPGTEIKKIVFLLEDQGEAKLLDYGLSQEKPLSSPLRRQIELQLYPPPPVEIRLQAHPQGNGFAIEALVETKPGQPRRDWQLRFSSSSGQLGPVEKLAAGHFRVFLNPGPAGWKKIYLTASPEGVNSAAFLELVEGEIQP